jgi:hypothetical protein
LESAQLVRFQKNFEYKEVIFWSLKNPKERGIWSPRTTNHPAILGIPSIDHRASRKANILIVDAWFMLFQMRLCGLA